METIDRLIRALQFPLDDPSRTLIAVLVVVAAGLLVAVVLIAIASPEGTKDTSPSAEPNDDDETDSAVGM